MLGGKEGTAEAATGFDARRVAHGRPVLVGGGRVHLPGGGDAHSRTRTETLKEQSLSLPCLPIPPSERGCGQWDSNPYPLLGRQIISPFIHARGAWGEGSTSTQKARRAREAAPWEPPFVRGFTKRLHRNRPS
eukprot:scaffold3070_cov1604-Pavlova_lutheri.AAC.3